MENLINVIKNFNKFVNKNFKKNFELKETGVNDDVIAENFKNHLEIVFNEINELDLSFTKTPQGREKYKILNFFFSKVIDIYQMNETIRPQKSSEHSENIHSLHGKLQSGYEILTIPTQNLFTLTRLRMSDEERYSILPYFFDFFMLEAGGTLIALNLCLLSFSLLGLFPGWAAGLINMERILSFSSFINSLTVPFLSFNLIMLAFFDTAMPWARSQLQIPLLSMALLLTAMMFSLCLLSIQNYILTLSLSFPLILNSLTEIFSQFFLSWELCASLISVTYAFLSHRDYDVEKTYLNLRRPRQLPQDLISQLVKKEEVEEVLENVNPVSSSVSRAPLYILGALIIGGIGYLAGGENINSAMDFFSSLIDSFKGEENEMSRPSFGR